MDTITPTPMRLCCEGCGQLHIDEGEFSTKPHHTHSCQFCGLTWRPAVGPTVGVRFLPGFKNTVPEPVRGSLAAAAAQREIPGVKSVSDALGKRPGFSDAEVAGLQRVTCDFWRNRESERAHIAKAQAALDAAGEPPLEGRFVGEAWVPDVVEITRFVPLADLPAPPSPFDLARHVEPVAP